VGLAEVKTGGVDVCIDPNCGVEGTDLGLVNNDLILCPNDLLCPVGI